MKIFFGLVKMTFGLVDVGYSLPESVKLIFFAPCIYMGTINPSFELENYFNEQKYMNGDTALLRLL